MPQARTRKGATGEREQTGTGSRGQQTRNARNRSARPPGRQQRDTGRGQPAAAGRRSPEVYLNADIRRDEPAGLRGGIGFGRQAEQGRGYAQDAENKTRREPGADSRTAPETSRSGVSVRHAGRKDDGRPAARTKGGDGSLFFDERAEGREAGPERPPGASKPEDEPQWKSAVRQYIKLCNQAEIDRAAPWFDGAVADEDHLLRYYHRLERLRERELLRGVLPVRSQTKAELLRVSVSESLGEASAVVRQRVTRTIRQQGLTYTEERLESERLWIASEPDGCRIVRIEPVVGERRPKYGLSAEPALPPDRSPGEEAGGSPQSVPYINYELLPNFKHGRAGVRYRRDLAAAYADRWWNEPNPAYENFEVNCTNYVSQCLFAGHAPMNYTGKRDSGWWYRGRSGGREMWSYSWAVAGALQRYLSTPRASGLRATVVDSADELELGDVIIYDWSGDGRFQHSTIVTAFDAAGMPLVNANTVPSRHRYWDYTDSYAWTERTQYRFFHIADEL